MGRFLGGKGEGCGSNGQKIGDCFRGDLYSLRVLSICFGNVVFCYLSSVSGLRSRLVEYTASDHVQFAQP